ncbi:MAG: PilZ domain-containing protein [Bdellovibrionales bacterium]|nr:PilZ domain-containing protein [Bdellovibrionales bacterium]
MNTENPRRIRSQVETRVIWTFEDNPFEGHSHDLSVNGIYIKSTERPAIDQSIDIQIYLPGDPNFPRITSKAQVIRHDDHGFAAQFAEMDYKSFEHLKNLVAYQNSDPDQVFQEQEIRPGIK